MKFRTHISAWLKSHIGKEFTLAGCLYFFLACVALFQIFQGRVYQQQSYIDQFFPWRYEIHGAEPGAVEPENPWLLDASVYVAPQDAFIKDAFEQGEFPLWNPRQLCGYPIVANSQSELCYPLKVGLLASFDRETAHNLYLLIHLWLGGWAFYLFCRLWFPHYPALVGGCLWMLEGFMTCYLESKMIVVGVTLPLTLASTEYLLRRPTWARASLLGFLGGGLFLTAHKQFTIYVYLLAGFFFLARLYQCRDDGLTVKRLKTVLGAFGTALLVGAPLLLPYLEFGSLAGRPPAGLFQVFDANRFFPETLLTLFLPEFLGSPATGFYLSRMSTPVQTPIELTHHVGMVGMLLVSVGVQRRDFVSRFFGWTSLYLVLACSIPVVYAPLYYLVPVVKYLTPTRILILLSFSLCFLAVGGIQKLQDDRDQRTNWVPVVVYFVVLAAVLYWVSQVQGQSPWFRDCLAAWTEMGTFRDRVPAFTMLNAHSDELIQRLFSFYSLSNPALWLPCLCGGLFLLTQLRGSKTWQRTLLPILILCELLFFFYRWNPTTPRGQTFPDFPALELLADRTDRMVGVWDVTKPNSLTAYSLMTPAGYESIRPQRYAELFAVWQGAPPKSYHVISAKPQWALFWDWCSLFGVKYATRTPLTRFEFPPDWKLVYDREFEIFENPEPPLRAWLVTNWHYAPTRNEGLDRMTKPDFDFRSQAIVHQAIPGGEGEPGRGGEAKISSYGTNRILIDTKVEKSSLLVVSDNHYPGWVAEVDGQAREVIRVNQTFRGVRLEPGDTSVLLSFRPMAFYLGLGLGLFGLILLVIMARTYKPEEIL